MVPCPILPGSPMRPTRIYPGVILISSRISFGSLTGPFGPTAGTTLVPSRIQHESLLAPIWSPFEHTWFPTGPKLEPSWGGPILQGLPSAGLTWTHLGTIVVPYWVQLGSLDGLMRLILEPFWYPAWNHQGPFRSILEQSWFLVGLILDYYKGSELGPFRSQVGFFVNPSWL